MNLQTLAAEINGTVIDGETILGAIVFILVFAAILWAINR